ncbi:LLM class F420-dependent oxidoreductase [uncultured Amnibacterium sp.]|uniref:LLM class F420-dependent oxidoreductase n=1 Tax=uncultured Amnibacterium sp. TaxID=1631851 RepID=UPI0035CBCE8E
MELCIFTEPQQGASYDTQLRHAQATERLEFTGWFRSDHYLAMHGADGLPGPTDAWTTLAGLARETSRVRLGTLVSSVTYRVPGLLAIQVAQVDAMSGGRAELGLGTGWYGAEHAAYGIPFPAKRFGLLEEALQVVTGLWGTPVGERFSFAGEFFTLTDSPALPKSVQERIPVIVGGMGPRRTPAIAAAYATEYNANFGSEDELAAAIDRVRAAAAAIGRDPGTIKFSTAQHTILGRTEAQYRQRADHDGVEPDAHRAGALGGSVDEARERIAKYAELGIDRVYLQVFDMADLDHLELLAELLD